MLKREGCRDDFFYFFLVHRVAAAMLHEQMHDLDHEEV